MAGEKTILITGCSAHSTSTILAQELAKDGHHVFVGAPDITKISSKLTALPTVTPLQLETKAPASVSDAAKAVRSATQRLGEQGLDVLINDGGSGHSLALLDVMMESARDMYDAKVAETLSVTGAFVDLLARKRGRVVNLGSSGAFITAPYKPTHYSSKGALTGLSERLRSELTPWGIGVTSVMLETMPSATGSQPRVLFPEKSSYSSIKDVVSRWTLGSSRSDEGTIASLVDLVLEDSTQGQTWQWSTYFRGSDADEVSKIEKGIVRPVAA